jgi:HPt (histidine-containing phosphotransfer) domain-containing protein
MELTMNEAYVLNRQLILERLGGDEEIFAVMVDMYLQDVDSYCRNIEEALAAGVVTTLQREAHTIKGLLATFADDPGTEVAYGIEKQAKAGHLAGLAAPVAAIQARLREVGEVLKVETGQTG